MVLFIVLTLLCVSDILHPAIAQQNPSLKTYIVHINVLDTTVLSVFKNLNSYYHSFLPKTLSSLDQQSQMVHTYSKVVNGFAARL